MLAIATTWSLCARAAQSSPSTLQAREISADIKLYGAKAVVAKLWADNRKWDEIMANIGRGDRGWLEVAVALNPGTDAGASEELNEAMFLALKPAPVTVLHMLKKQQFATAFVCSSNIGTDYSPEQSRLFINERIAVLESLSDSEIQGSRDECLKGLRAALKDFAEQD